jgi:hypothetical protein
VFGYANFLFLGSVDGFFINVPVSVLSSSMFKGSSYSDSSSSSYLTFYFSSSADLKLYSSDTSSSSSSRTSTGGINGIERRNLPNSLYIRAAIP